MERAEIFEKIYRDYLKQVSNLNLKRIEDKLGLTVDGHEAVVPFLGMLHRISAQGIVDNQGRRPTHTVSVILCKYLLMCPDMEPPEVDWVTYKDFKDAAPFVSGFLNNAEKPITQNFTGRLSSLEKACGELGGRSLEEDFSSDLAIRFEALPKVPLLMLFNDRDDEFPAQCSLLFERRAEKYLDMECLAMTGWVLSEWLQRRAH